jgi:hypothetical protein
MMYELWHIASGNLLEDFETESEALDAVRGYVEANGDAIIDELSVSAAPTSAAEASSALPPALRGEALRRRANVVIDVSEQDRRPEQRQSSSPFNTSRV